mgnify:CR=1 FL=1
MQNNDLVRVRHMYDAAKEAINFAYNQTRETLESDRMLTLALIKSIEKGKPYLGICLGLQVLFSESDEFGKYRGLDVFSGKVIKFQFADFEKKVPHMGWNNINIIKKPPILSEIPDNAFFYFVHSFYVVPDDSKIIAATTDYGITFTSMIWKDNVFATQFHPEKSQELGLKLLTGFGKFVKHA